MFKYCYKEENRAIAVVVSAGNETKQRVDEVRLFQDGRYVEASEASWRILQFPMHREFPSVFRLAIHLPDQQPVTFDPSRNRTDDGTNPLTRVLAQAQHTILTRWFQFNKEKK